MSGPALARSSLDAMEVLSNNLSRELMCWPSYSDSLMPQQNITSANHILKEGPGVGRSGVVGKRPRKTQAYIISLQQPLHSNPMCDFSPLCAAVLSVLFSTVLFLVDARLCSARGFWRCSSSPTPASPPLVLQTPAPACAFGPPPAIKPFPTNVSSSVTKTASVPTSSGWKLQPWLCWESLVSAVSSKYLIMEFPGNTRKVSITVIITTSAEEWKKDWYVSKVTWLTTVEMAQEDNWKKSICLFSSELKERPYPLATTKKRISRKHYKNTHHQGPFKLWVKKFPIGLVGPF